ncbi:MAG: hypothetical protein AB1453_03040 [Chloroflexota bacterium]|jgi:hypothetical protein
MTSTTETPSVAPPRLIPTITAGFNAVAANIRLIVLPVLLDVFLWLGPQFRLHKLAAPALEEYLALFNRLNSADIAAQMNQISQQWLQNLRVFNLAGVLPTFPIGLPSLIATYGTDQTPLGSAQIIEIQSYSLALGWWLVFLLVGFLLGCIYFNDLARSTFETRMPFDLKNFLRQISQSVLFIVALFFSLLVMGIPASILISILAMVNPSLASVGIIFILFIILWVLIPLVFTPHSIFLGQRNLLVSVLTSARLVRSYLPGSGLFILVAFMIAQGMDILWQIPPPNSWMTLVGILGHSFIYTSLLAASFIYFRKGLHWLADVAKQQNNRTVQQI